MRHNISLSSTIIPGFRRYANHNIDVCIPAKHSEQVAYQTRCDMWQNTQNYR